MEKFIGYCVLLGLELWFLTRLGSILGSGIEDNQEEKENDHKGLIMGVIMIVGIYVMLTVIKVAPKFTSDLL
ncbi:MAG: hypothetical protein E6729_10775 [Finegoldia magna]|nr:hypothetical protein [Finegoldia magna]